MSTCIACGGKRPAYGYGVACHDPMNGTAEWRSTMLGMLCLPCADTTADARNAAIHNGTAVEDTYTMVEAKR